MFINLNVFIKQNNWFVFQASMYCQQVKGERSGKSTSEVIDEDEDDGVSNRKNRSVNWDDY